MKIVVIGGGSSYTPELIEGIINRNEILKCSNITLVDIEEGREKQSIITNLSKRMVDKANEDIEIVESYDRKSALKGADFVAIQMRIGQIEARITDETIPAKYGYIGQETNGFGGFFKGLRTIPVGVEIANEVASICPEAYIVNFANPSAMLTEAMLKYSKHDKVIGLCNGPLNTKKAIAQIMKINEEDIYCEFSGSNHMSFVTKVIYNGKDIISQVIDELNKQETDALAYKNVSNEVFEPEFLKGLNMIPSSYLKYYVKKTQVLEHQKEEINSGSVRAQVVADIEKELFEVYKDESIREKPKQLENRGGANYSSAAIDLILSLATNRNDIQTVNVLNNGTISNLDDDCVIETNCLITSFGAMPISIGTIDDSIQGLINNMKKFEKQTIEAALSGDYHKGLVAITFNPLVQSDVDAKKIYDEMLVANEQYLPNFKNAIENLKSKQH